METRKQILYLKLQRIHCHVQWQWYSIKSHYSKRSIDFNRIRLSESVYSAVNERFTRKWKIYATGGSNQDNHTPQISVCAARMMLSKLPKRCVFHPVPARRLGLWCSRHQPKEGGTKSIKLFISHFVTSVEHLTYTGFNPVHAIFGSSNFMFPFLGLVN